MVSLKKIALAFALVLSSAFVSAGSVNINNADADALAAAINGVGLAKAAAIIAYREQHGPFKSVDELSLVKGIGPGIVKKNRDTLTK